MEYMEQFFLNDCNIQFVRKRGSTKSHVWGGGTDVNQQMLSGLLLIFSWFGPQKYAKGAGGRGSMPHRIEERTPRKGLLTLPGCESQPAYIREISAGEGVYISHT